MGGGPRSLPNRCVADTVNASRTEPGWFLCVGTVRCPTPVILPRPDPPPTSPSHLDACTTGLCAAHVSETHGHSGFFALAPTATRLPNPWLHTRLGAALFSLHSARRHLSVLSG